MLSLTNYLIALDDESVTQRLAEAIAQSFSMDVYEQLFINQTSAFQWHLHGELGVGKTTFVRALLRGCGYQGRVRSPTYTLCESYTLSLNGHKLDVYHFDLYRLADPREWDDAGFRDLLNQPALCLLEWPERANLTMPDINMTITYTETLSRLAKFEHCSVRGQSLLASLKTFQM